MGLMCHRYCINQIESVCYQCDHSMIKGRIPEEPETPHGDEWAIEDEMMDERMRNLNTYNR